MKVLDLFLFYTLTFRCPSGLNFFLKTTEAQQEYVS